MRDISRRLVLFARSVVLLSGLLLAASSAFVACDSDYPAEFVGTGGEPAQASGGRDPGTGGADATGGIGGDASTGGGNATGGNATGGNATGGNATGGNATGGSTPTGGTTATGGRTGGTGTGGAGTGGIATGGRATGGAATGGAGSGGASGCGATTYASFGMSFMSKYCVSCHSTFGTLAGVKAGSSMIKSRTVTGTNMPPASFNPKPTSAERAQLGAWIDCGLP